MKTIGIIGGTGPESTIEYYKRIVAAYRERTGGDFPSIIINSINATPLLAFVAARQLDRITELLTTEIARLARAGADFGLISANTPHVVFDDVRARSPISLISIVEATADAAKMRGLSKLALFGTQTTMGANFYPDVFARQGLTIITPNEDERVYIHEKYMGELFNGIVLPETRERLVTIMRAMRERDGIDGVILGGTELSLIFTEPQYDGVPVLDTTQIHVEATVAMALTS